MTIQIEFKLTSTGELLGSVVKDNIEKALIPKWSDDHKTFISRNFKAYPNTSYWEVNSVIPLSSIDPANKKTIITVELSPNKDALKSYGQQARDLSYSDTASYIKKFDLVDVDFGHHSSLLSPSNVEQSNTLFYSILLKSELHKRRPCIVLSKTRHTVQVIPLTSRDNGGLEISLKSFEKLAQRYRKAPSFALPEQIQSVSTFRVFPMRLRNNKFAKAKEKTPIDSLDKEAIKELMAKIYHPLLAREHSQLQASNDNLSAQNEVLRELMTLIGPDLGETGDADSIFKALKEAYLPDSSSIDTSGNRS